MCKVQQKRTSKNLCINPTNWVLSSSMNENKVDKKIEFMRKHWDLFTMTKNSTLKELFTKDKSVTLHDKSIQVFVAEMFKVKEPIS